MDVRSGQVGLPGASAADERYRKTRTEQDHRRRLGYGERELAVVGERQAAAFPTASVAVAKQGRIGGLVDVTDAAGVMPFDEFCL